VVQYKDGDRLVVAHLVPCNACRRCLRGRHTASETTRETKFSEYLKVPQINVDYVIFPISYHVSYEEASITEPLACVYRGQKRANLQPGQNILVLGNGLADLIHISLARALGAGRIIASDRVNYRLEAAR